jgi:hypothetical protein
MFETQSHHFEWFACLKGHTHITFSMVFSSSKKQGKICVAVFHISCCMIIIEMQHSVDGLVFSSCYCFGEKVGGAEKV